MRIVIVTTATLMALSITSCQRQNPAETSTSSLQEVTDASDSVGTSEEGESARSEQEGFQSFAFFEGIPADGKRSPSRNDGTSRGMPCITRAVINRGEAVKYDFWHGHNRELHRFTLTVEDLGKLKSGTSIEVFTAVVDGHKHAVKIDLQETCVVKSQSQE